MIERLNKLPISPTDERLDLVIVYCDEKLDWVSDLFPRPDSINLFIMSKCGNSASVQPLLSRYTTWLYEDLRNIGQESIGFTQYILSHVERTNATHALLVHGDPFSHTDYLYFKLLARIYKNGFFKDVPFLHLSNRRFLTGSSFCLRDLQSNAMGFVDPVIGSYCCSQFIVRKDRLFAAKSAAANFHRYLNGDESGLKCSQKRIEGHRAGHHISMSLENLWPRVLGEDAVLPARQHDERLPLLLRNEMLTEADLNILKYFDSLNI
jgi:hypothetical protein